MHAGNRVKTALKSQSMNRSVLVAMRVNGQAVSYFEV
jgi:hypothetical protein